MSAYPLREFGLVRIAGSHGKHCQGRISLCCAKPIPVKSKKQAHSQESSALVPVNKSVVLRQTQAIGSRKTGNIWLAIQRQIQGTRKRRLQQTFVTQTTCTTVFRQAFIMQQQQHLAVDPFPVAHLASW